MPFTFRDEENFRKDPPRASGAWTFLARILRPIMRTPVIKKYLSNLPAWHIGAISRFGQQQDHEKAVEVAIRALERFGQGQKSIPEFNKDDSWSFIMRLAVRNLQRCNKVAADEWQKLIQMAEDRTPRREGYDIAYSFLAFSRWKLQEKA